MLDVRRLEREVRKAEKAAERAMRARAALPPGSSRARVTTANARWAAAAEHRDRLREMLELIRMGVEKVFTLKEALEKVSWPDVERRLVELYPDQKPNLKGYERVFAELQMLDPAANPDRNRICVRRVPPDPRFGGGETYDVYIYNPRKKTDYAPAFYSWQDWLGFFVDERAETPLIDVVCHALYEMTYDGFDRPSVEEKQNRIRQALESAAKGIIDAEEGGTRT